MCGAQALPRSVGSVDQSDLGGRRAVPLCLVPSSFHSLFFTYFVSVTEDLPRARPVLGSEDTLVR